jgi:hypothetical protein
MRIGTNPNNHKEIDLTLTSHRVIIPVYIPNSEGYFKEALSVFKVCIESLLKTINCDTSISIISNNSSKEVNEYIQYLWQENKIDRVIFNKENVGKMNAIVAETRASHEEYITYSDADVFFDKGWLKQTFNMFNDVSNAGFVSMNPTPYNYAHADSTILSNLFTILFKKQKTSNVCSFDDLEHFHKSIGKEESFTKRMFNGNVFSIQDGKNYIIGAGHFCCTIRKTPTFKFVPKVPSKIGVSGGSEAIYLDIPFDKSGLLRLSSPKAFVWHMGNVLEKDWADKKLESLNGFKEDIFLFQSLKFKDVAFSSKFIPYIFKNKFISLLKKTNVLK